MSENKQVVAAREIKAGDRWLNNRTIFWTALADAEIVDYNGVVSARVLVEYAGDGGQGHRHWNPDQAVEVAR